MKLLLDTHILVTQIGRGAASLPVVTVYHANPGKQRRLLRRARGSRS
jgi:hypothetical protein